MTAPGPADTRPAGSTVPPRSLGARCSLSRASGRPPAGQDDAPERRPLIAGSRDAARLMPGGLVLPPRAAHFEAAEVGDFQGADREPPHMVWRLRTDAELPRRA